MSVAQTSLLAHEEVQGVLETRHAEVLRAMTGKQDFSNMELAQRLGWSINRVTPRVKELRDAGLVQFKTIRSCKITGRAVKTWVRT